MSDQVFFCPGCRKAYDGHRRPPNGQLFDCPNCQLLFAPADKDFAGGVAPREYQTEWADEGMRVAPKPPSSRPIHRKLKPVRPHDLIVVWITGGAMLGIAAIIFAIVQSGRNSPPTSQPFDLPPRVVAETATTSPADSPLPPTASPIPAKLDEQNLLGEWESIDHPIVGQFRGEVFSLTFEPNGALAMQLRFGLQIDAVKGRWRLSGSTLTLQFGELETVRDVAISIEWLGADRLRLTALGREPAEFRKVR